MENDFGVEAVRLFDWLICLMKRKGAVKLPFPNVVKYKLSETAKDWSEKEIEKTSEAIGYGAVKYADLKINRLTNYTFNFDQMLNDKGNTAVYLLYAHARICSIIRKSGKDREEIKRNGIIILDHEDERLLGLHLLQFPEVFEETCSNLSPNVLCEYRDNLAEIFTFYKKVLF